MDSGWTRFGPTDLTWPDLTRPMNTPTDTNAIRAQYHGHSETWWVVFPSAWSSSHLFIHYCWKKANVLLKRTWSYSPQDQNDRGRQTGSKEIMISNDCVFLTIRWMGTRHFYLQPFVFLDSMNLGSAHLLKNYTSIVGPIGGNGPGRVGSGRVGLSTWIMGLWSIKTQSKS